MDCYLLFCCHDVLDWNGAVQENQDVFNCLDMMDNATMFKEMKFGPGDGLLHYYLYNWKCPQMDNSKVGLILV